MYANPPRCFERGAELDQDKAKQKLLKIYTTGQYLPPDYRKGYKYMKPEDWRYQAIFNQLNNDCTSTHFRLLTVVRLAKNLPVKLCDGI